MARSSRFSLDVPLDLPSYGDYGSVDIPKGGMSKQDLEDLARELGLRTRARGSEDLQQAQATLDTARDRAKAAGIDTSSRESAKGTGGGLVSSALSALDYLGSVVRSGVREGVDALDKEGDPSLQDFREQINERKGAGDLFESLSVDEGDNLGERALKYLGSFGTDVALDPTTYVTAGTGALFRRGGAKAVKEGVDQAVEKGAREGAEEGTEEAAEEAVEGVGRVSPDELLESNATREAIEPRTGVANDLLKGARREQSGRFNANPGGTGYSVGRDAPGEAGAMMRGGRGPSPQKQGPFSTDVGGVTGPKGMPGRGDALRVDPQGQANLPVTRNFRPGEQQQFFNDRLLARARGADDRTDDFIRRDVPGKAHLKAHQNKRFWNKRQRGLPFESQDRAARPFNRNELPGEQQNLFPERRYAQARRGMDPSEEVPGKSFLKQNQAKRYYSRRQEGLPFEYPGKLPEPMFGSKNVPATIADVAQRTGPIASRTADDAAQGFADDAAQKAIPSKTVSDAAEDFSDELTDAGLKPSLGDEAAEAYTLGGPRRVKRLLRERVGVEEANRIFDELPRDVRGGLNVRIPGKKDPIASFAAGGKIPESVGLGKLSEAPAMAAAKARTTSLGRAVGDRFGGEMGQFYGRFVDDLMKARSRDAKNLATEGSGANYARYNGINDAVQTQKWAGQELSRRGQDVLATAGERINQASDVEAAKEARDRFFKNPEEMERALDDANPMGLSEDERIGAQVAKFYRNYLNEMPRVAGKYDVTMGDMGKNYTPRLLTQEGKEMLDRRANRVKDAKSASAQGNYDPTTSRKAFMVPDEDAPGNFRWATLDEANELMRNTDEPVEKFFEDDASRIIAGYTSGLRKKTRDEVLTQGLRDAGLVFDDEAAQGLKKISTKNSSLPSQLQGKWAPQEVADGLQKHFDVAQGNSKEMEKWFKDVWEPLFATWKASTTIARGPGYHTRNLMGGLYNNWIAGVGARSHQKSSRIVKERVQASKQAKQEVREGSTEKSIGQRTDELLKERLPKDLYELHERAEQAGITAQKVSRELPGQRKLEDLSSDQLEAQATGTAQRFPDSKTGRVANKILSGGGMKNPVKIGSSMAETSEAFMRIAAFDEGLQRYGTTAGGKRLADATQFNYQDLSPKEEIVRNRWAPFFVWAKNNVPLQFKSLFFEPGKINRMMHANQEAQAAFGENDVQGVMPDWMAQRFGWEMDPDVLPGMVKNNLNPEEGSNRKSPLYMGLESPLVDLERWTQGISGAGREAVSSLGPQVTVPFEQLTGIDTFTGRQKDPRGEEAPLLAQAIPGVPTQKDDEGTERVSPAIAGLITDAIPFAGPLERAFGSMHPDSPYYGRRASNLHSFLGPFPGQTGVMTPDSEAGATQAKANELRTKVDKSIPENQEAIINALLDEGIEPSKARQFIEKYAGQLPEMNRPGLAPQL